jgi:hypothetical protein
LDQVGTEASFSHGRRLSVDGWRGKTCGFIMDGPPFSSYCYALNTDCKRRVQLACGSAHRGWSMSAVVESKLGTMSYDWHPLNVYLL